MQFLNLVITFGKLLLNFLNLCGHGLFLIFMLFTEIIHITIKKLQILLLTFGFLMLIIEQLLGVFQFRDSFIFLSFDIWQFLGEVINLVILCSIHILLKGFNFVFQFSDPFLVFLVLLLKFCYSWCHITFLWAFNVQFTFDFLVVPLNFFFLSTQNVVFLLQFVYFVGKWSYLVIRLRWLLI